MIEFKGIAKSYGQETIVLDISFKVEKGSLVVLIGPSGCGKTTLLKMVNRLINPSAGDPDVILMDEPFSALDPLTRLQLQDELADLQGKMRKTILFVTHDMDEAIKIADKICLLNDGAIVQYATVEEMIKNTATGLMNINHDMLEAAKGIYMTRFQVLVKVRLPLSLPVIMAGAITACILALAVDWLGAIVEKIVTPVCFKQSK